MSPRFISMWNLNFLQTTDYQAFYEESSASVVNKGLISDTARVITASQKQIRWSSTCRANWQQIKSRRPHGQTLVWLKHLEWTPLTDCDETQAATETACQRCVIVFTAEQCRVQSGKDTAKHRITSYATISAEPTWIPLRDCMKVTDWTLTLQTCHLSLSHSRSHLHFILHLNKEQK